MAYLGHIILADGVVMDSDKVAAVDTWSTPKTLRALHGFLGLTEDYRKFIARYGDIARPLRALLKHNAFQWSPEAVPEASAHDHPGFTASRLQQTICD
jgi:hypothetical protein